MAKQAIFGELDYAPCRYGGSRTVFRGPRVPLDGAYTAVIGGSEVYGRYVAEPFPALLARRTGARVVNLGIVNAGVDAFLSDEPLMHVIAAARIAVVQLSGVHNISNRLYTVHPRRNDRFLRASRILTDLYRTVDFSDFAFTRHMLVTLRRTCPERFAQVELELAEAWQARMRTLLSHLGGRRVLLQIDTREDYGVGPEPAFVTPLLLDGLEGRYDEIVRCDLSDDVARRGADDMIFPPARRAAALRMLSPEGHECVANALAQALRLADDGIAA